MNDWYHANKRGRICDEREKHAERAVFVASAKINSMDFVPNRNGVLLEPHVVVAR